jgi:hypothetical protein
VRQRGIQRNRKRGSPGTRLRFCERQNQLASVGNAI